MKKISKDPFKRIIWSSDINFEDWADYREDRKAEGRVLSDDEFYNEVTDLNNMYLDDARVHLNKSLSNTIICIADLGLWNGRKPGYKIIGNRISDCLYSDADINTWYIDKNGDFCCDAIHHDGINYYRYRVFKDNISEDQINNFCYKVYDGVVTSKDISRYTRRIGPEIAKVYGFDCPGKRQK